MTDDVLFMQIGGGHGGHRGGGGSGPFLVVV